LTCCECPHYHLLSTLDRRISDFYHKCGIYKYGEITLHAFDHLLSIRVVRRTGTTYTTQNKDKWIVWLDNTLSLPERRVRMAHEIGHMLRHSGTQFFGDEIRRLKQEEQARRFALYALVPTCFLLPLLHEETDQRALRVELAELFGVPDWFMHERLERLYEDEVVDVMNDVTSNL
jgi:Zn-dependent peptidase ImmA (M78 family)